MKSVTDAIAKYCERSSSDDGATAVMTASLESIRDIDGNIARRSLYVAILMTVFEFIKRASVGEITIGGVQITELSVIERLLPIVAAYILLSVWNLIAARRFLECIFDAFIEGKYPELWDANLEVFLRPPHIIKTYKVVQTVTSKAWARVIDWSVTPIIFFAAFIGPIFWAYASYSLIGKYGSADILSWISIIAAGFFSVQMFVLMIAVDNAVERAPTEVA